MIQVNRVGRLNAMSGWRQLRVHAADAFWLHLDSSACLRRPEGAVDMVAGKYIFGASLNGAPFPSENYELQPRQYV
jgi:hypothetical protein